MTIPTNSLNESEPAGADQIALGDNVLRKYKTQNREILEVDHDYPSSGQASTAGQHKKVTLQEQADLGTGAVNATLLGSQTIDGKGELVYTDEDDNDIQLTSGGGPYLGSPANVAAIAGIMNLIYPIGYVITLGVSTNPGTLLGIGTWTAIEGKVIVGKASSGTFNTLDGTGGAETVTLTAAESGLPAHTHTVTNQRNANGWSSGNFFQGSNDSGPVQNLTVPANSSADASSAHNNLQPYIVKYVWQRTA